MKEPIVAFISGVVFAVGLAVAGMTQPAKVIGFLDFFGSWDPSLAFVMGGAILVYLPASRVAVLRNTPMFAARYLLPKNKGLDRRLLIGASLFGVGWGLAGYCPGPAITSAGSASANALYFVGAMIVGMAAFEGMQTLIARRASRPEEAGQAS